jgi:hypothetical protein
MKEYDDSFPSYPWSTSTGVDEEWILEDCSGDDKRKLFF